MDLDRVEFVHDPESGGWAFRVPSLHITGGAQTEDQAKEMAREAILFSLDHPEKGLPADLTPTVTQVPLTEGSSRGRLEDNSWLI